MSMLSLMLRGLGRKWVRTLLTILSIFVAFMLFGFLAAIRVAFASGANVADADRLIVRHAVSIIQMLPETYGDRMRRIDGVKDVSHATWFGGIYQEPKNFFPQHPVIPDDHLNLYPELLLPAEQLQAWKKTRTGAIVGRTTADRFGFKVGDRVPIQATIWPKKDGTQTWTFDIVGIYDGAKSGTDTSPLFFRYDYFDEAHRGTRGQVGWYIVRVDDPKYADAVAEAIDQTFANSPAETKAETEGAFLAGFASQIGNIGAILTAIISAVFFTILLVAANTMAQSVRERTNELAVLKALGFGDGQVLWFVLGEALLIAGLGGFSGLLLSFTLITVVGDPTNGMLPVFYMPKADLGLGLLLVVLLGVGSGFLPALQARSLQIADALRR